MIDSLVLRTESIRFGELRRRILELYPDLDDQTLHDTLDGATNLREALEAIIRSALDDEALALALKSRLDQMRERFSRFGERAAAKRKAVAEAMQNAAIKRLESAEFTASMRTSAPSVIVTAAEKIPPAYWLPQPQKLDKANVRQALLEGDKIPGASLSESRQILSVRVV